MKNYKQMNEISYEFRRAAQKIFEHYRSMSHIGDIFAEISKMQKLEK